jgi:hypothetical protein
MKPKSTMAAPRIPTVELLAFSFFRPACVRCVLGARANRNRFIRTNDT